MRRDDGPAARRAGRPRGRPQPRPKRRLPLANASPRTRSVLLATGVLVVGISPSAVAPRADLPTPALAAGTTTVDVRTFDGAGAPADRGFHLSATC
jgi:hypothetical protein